VLAVLEVVAGSRLEIEEYGCWSWVERSGLSSERSAKVRDEGICCCWMLRVSKSKCLHE
jgi:hypothetical protein